MPFATSEDLTLSNAIFRIWPNEITRPRDDGTHRLTSPGLCLHCRH